MYLCDNFPFLLFSFFLSFFLCAKHEMIRLNILLFAISTFISAALASILPITASNSSLLWGTYRPNLYFGTRPRLPESVMTGLMWFDAANIQGIQRMRLNSFFFFSYWLMYLFFSFARHKARLWPRGWYCRIRIP